jgi:hypothetical protein
MSGNANANVSLTIHAATLADALKTLGAESQYDLKAFETSELIDELKFRLSQMSPPRQLVIETIEGGGMIVEGVAIASVVVDNTKEPAAALASEPKKRGRPRKVVEQAAPPTAPVQPEPTAEAEEVEAATHAAPATEPVVTVTREQIIEQLNEYKNLCGLVTVRQLMEGSYGSSKIIDIPTDKWPALLGDLKAKIAEAKAARAKQQAAA